MATRRIRKTELPPLAGASWLTDTRLQAVLGALNAGGGEARVAGGAVRNALMAVPVADIDIATTLPPQEVMRICKTAGFAVHPTGIEHGTVTVVHQHMPFEVTTLRHDVATDGRRATVAYTDDWAADAARRDFTMNALYCDLNGKIFDFTDGYDDIQKRRVRFVGQPSQRIKEDYLRILRFFRFHAHYGKGAPDAQGLAACARLRNGIANLSAERITQEMLKMLAAPQPVPALKAMEKAGVLRLVLPGRPDWRVLGRLASDALLRLFVLNGEKADLGLHFRMSNLQAERLRQMGEVPSISPRFRETERRKLLYHLGAQAYADAVSLGFARSRAARGDVSWRTLQNLAAVWQAPKFPVSGRDLQAIGLAPGPALGATLRRLEDWWIAGDFKASRQDLLARAK